MTAFVAQACEYCSSVERAAALPLPERLAVTRLRLLALYTAALDLPLVEPSDELACEHNPQLPANWPGFGEHDAYLEIFDPYIDEPPVGGSLSDDACDVYPAAGSRHDGDDRSLEQLLRMTLHTSLASAKNLTHAGAGAERAAHGRIPRHHGPDRLGPFDLAGNLRAPP
jgi:hypothetical protein